MNAMASRVPPPPAVFFKILILLTALFFILLGETVYLMRSAQPGVPLVPCRQCADKCPCPRLSGAVRCGCPQ